MPYRGPQGFSWRGNDVSTRRRALAAVVLLGAGWAVGFFAGRMSAWLLPIVETNAAVMANVAPRAASPPAAAPQREAVQAPAAPPAPETSAAATSEKAEPAPPQRASGAAAKDDTREQDASRAPGRDVVLVNPEWKQAPASQSDREPDAERRAYRPEAETRQGRFADESALAKCESRYSSFRRDDGTYQPYGRSTREPCPFLSDMSRRPRY